jgi:drug/metabolite transporter (DMT)-like permease
MAHENLAAVGFGLAASLSWGTSDFNGGLGARRAPIYGVTATSYVAGSVLLIVIALISREPFPAAADMFWGGLAGLGGVIGLTCLYQALATGRMGIAAPVLAVVGAVIPVLVSAFVDGTPGILQIAGFVLAIISVALISRQQSETYRRGGLSLALAAGVGFGIFFVLLDQISADAIFWPLVSARVVSLIAVIIVARTTRQHWHPTRAALPMILLAGILDVSGNTFFLLAAQSGRLDAATVLSSLYPAVTVILARMLLKEPIARVQAVGILAAVVAIPLIAL